jgi:ketosteroid isomerase-like protein
MIALVFVEVSMYKTTVRMLVRYSIKKLNAGDPSMLLKMASPDVELVFPGDNSWSRMFRPVVKQRQRHVTHQGIDECRAFAERFVKHRIQFVIEDILVNGPPWNTRIGLRVHGFALNAAGTDDYNNRLLAVLELKWGRLVRWEDYEDTERNAAWDLARASVEADSSG